MDSPDPILSQMPTFLGPLLESQYGHELAKSIAQGYAVRRPVTLRANTIKTTAPAISAALSAAGITSSSVPWSPDALVISQAREQDIQALDIYQQGQIYLQSLSSMIPPLVLAPRPGADILDMTAAPGGKTTQMAALTGNKARITACEMNIPRAQRLKFNVQKQAASCVYVMIADARRLDDFFSFDQILLDAPCSGSGILRLGDPKLFQRFTPALIAKTTAAQLVLLKKALKLLKPGGELVYSTCSILARENEDILLQALKGFPAEIEPISFPAMEALPMLPSSIPGTLCLRPDSLYEGFFVAKIRKRR